MFVMGPRGPMPIMPTMGPNGPFMGPNGPIMGPNGSIMGPNGPIMGFPGPPPPPFPFFNHHQPPPPHFGTPLPPFHQMPMPPMQPSYGLPPPPNMHLLPPHQHSNTPPPLPTPPPLGTDPITTNRGPPALDPRLRILERATQLPPPNPSTPSTRPVPSAGFLPSTPRTHDINPPHHHTVTAASVGLNANTRSGFPHSEMMTSSDIKFVVNKAMLPLETTDPYSEDYYFLQVL